MACGLLQTPPTNLPLLSSLPRSPTRTRSSPRLQHLGLVPLAAVILVLVLLIPMPSDHKISDRDAAGNPVCPNYDENRLRKGKYPMHPPKKNQGNGKGK